MTVPNPNGSYENLRVPTIDKPIFRSIAWLELGEMLAQRFDRDIYIFNASIEGTTSEMWAGEYLGRLRSAINLFQPDAIFWVQGESDSDSGFSYNQSLTNLRAIINAGPGPRWVMGIDSDYPVLKLNNFDEMSVRQAQKEIINEGLALEGPDMDQLRANPLVQMDSVRQHFMGDGFKCLAEAWFRKVERYL